MTTICIAGQASLAVGVLEDVLRNRPDLEVVGLPNPSEFNEGSPVERWQPSFRSALRSRSVPEASIDAVMAARDVVLISCEYERLLDVERFRTDRLYNIHFSLLPAHKGAFPATAAVLRGDATAGPTLHRIDAGIDTGPVIASSRFPLRAETTALDVYMECQIRGRRLVADHLENLIAGDSTGTEQPPDGSTFRSRRSLDFTSRRRVEPRAAAVQVVRQVAAMNFRPYQLPEFEGIPISGARVLGTRSIRRPGTVLHRDSRTVVVTTIDFDVELDIDVYPRLWQACAEGSVDEAQSLIPTMRRLDEWNDRGIRAAAIAIAAGHAEILRLLLEAGAATQPLDGLGHDALTLAKRADAGARKRLWAVLEDRIEDSGRFGSDESDR